MALLAYVLDVVIAPVQVRVNEPVISSSVVKSCEKSVTYPLPDHVPMEATAIDYAATVPAET